VVEVGEVHVIDAEVAVRQSSVNARRRHILNSFLWVDLHLYRFSIFTFHNALYTRRFEIQNIATRVAVRVTTNVPPTRIMIQAQ